nr:TM0106 family RecB-like putative nuclease [Bacteriovorax sp. HI3]
MKDKKDYIQLSASDLSNFLSCKHLTELDKKVIKGDLKKPEWNNPHVKILQEKGFLHEENYLTFLQSKGLTITKIPEDAGASEAFELTIKAMESGADIIAQGVLKEGEWFGKTDILKKVEGKCVYGNYSYVVMDTKLSKETKAGAVLQLCLYSELLERVINSKPEVMFVVTPGNPFNEIEFRVSEYQSYYRLIKSYLISFLRTDNNTYPEPVSHCDVCKWFETCDKQRRNDDHISFVAGISTIQRKDLSSVGITTLEAFANAPIDFLATIIDVNIESLSLTKEQARLQFEARVTGKPTYEVLPILEERGLNRLPIPTEGDIFFDLEGDSFFKDLGIEYLWGFSYCQNGKLQYEHRWSFDFKEEKENFEWFIDYVMIRKKKHPNFKIYHYASYETGALKRLMGRYGTKEIEVDHLLRTGTFVDLYSITRQSIRAGIEKYSIKDLEQFYGYKRKANLRELIAHKRGLEHSLELNRLDMITEEARDFVRTYNRDDTDSTFYLREWLEGLRSTEAKKGHTLTRPVSSDGEIAEELDAHLKMLNELKNLLQKDINPVPEQRTSKEQAQWLLGDLISFYRREDKVNFWEKFRLKELDALELLEDKSGIGGLKFIKEIAGGTARCPIHRYKFTDQVVDIKKECPVYKEGILSGEDVKSFGEVTNISYEENYVDIKKKTGMSEFHPNAFWAWNHIDKSTKADRLFELAKFVLEKGIDSPELNFKAARDILLRNNPDFKAAINLDNPDTLMQAKEMALALNHSYLAIQGPPGTGKSYTASRVVLELVKQGYKVGVTGLSHKVISNLMSKIHEASVKENVPLNIYQKTKLEEETNKNIKYIQSKGLDEVLNMKKPFVLGGTDFMWASENCTDKVDYLIVDEAGQFSLVGIMSIAHVAKNIILLGDGSQLKQPIQGAHPPGCEVSALDYIVGDHQTLPKEKGVFLPVTYRLHPDICQFNSELFYENRLKAVDGNQCQNIIGKNNFVGKNLAYVEVEHWGNTNYSIEEAQKIKEIVEELVTNENTFTLFKDGKEISFRVTYEAIKIISPYNAQVNRLKQLLPEVSIGTVDKFQGQEAPIIIYSMATSSQEDAPRGMEFLYSGNRLNVAVSRAECLFIMVANKEIFEPNCKSPAQIKLANSFCRFLEIVKEKSKKLTI